MREMGREGGERMPGKTVEGGKKVQWDEGSILLGLGKWGERARIEGRDRWLG